MALCSICFVVSCSPIHSSPSNSHPKNFCQCYWCYITDRYIILLKLCMYMYTKHYIQIKHNSINYTGRDNIPTDTDAIGKDQSTAFDHNPSKSKRNRNELILLREISDLSLRLTQNIVIGIVLLRVRMSWSEVYDSYHHAFYYFRYCIHSYQNITKNNYLSWVMPLQREKCSTLFKWDSLRVVNCN